MMQRRMGARLTVTVVAFGLAVGLLGAGYRAVAGGATAAAEFSPVQPVTDVDGTRPGQAAAEVEWTVTDLAFESRYPQGFSFTATITSSAGPVVRGRVIWSHAPGTQRSRPITIDPVTGQLSVVWNVGVGESIPPWVGIRYHWDVGDAAGNSFQSEPQYVEYADTSRAWIRTESADIIVFSTGLPREVNELTMAAMAEQRETYRAAWGDLLPYKPRAILFGDRAAWSEWRLGAMNRAVIGLTSDDWGGTAQVVSGLGGYRDLAYSTVLHEVAHLYQAQFTIMPAGTWFIEGNATFFELEKQYDYEGTVRAMARRGELPALLQGTGPGVSGRNARRGYDIGYTFFKWLTETYGLDAHRELIELLDRGIYRNQALEAVTGLPVEEIERRWRVWLGASPIVPTLIPTPTPLMFPSPTPYGR